MPSYGDAFPDADRWALAYYILSLSAFTDPLRGEPLTSLPQIVRRSTIRSCKRRVRSKPMDCCNLSAGPTGRVTRKSSRRGG